ncbi:MAG: RagB/SusD family nutrient uptake outer membrane protein [Balneolaceae bacterium]|nr:MAG: RagB/SusD family nutrient uptake outer membrane protein [Balneolaceae bacterium]
MNRQMKTNLNTKISAAHTFRARLSCLLQLSQLPHSPCLLRMLRNNLPLQLRNTLPVLLVLVLFTGCESHLDKTPLGQQTTENFFTDEEEAIQATNASYNKLRDWNIHVFDFLGLTDMISDDATKGSTPTDAAFLNELETLTHDAGHQSVLGWWIGNYQGIYRTNVNLQNLPDTDMNPDLRNRLMAENRFLRAYFYFNLVRGYGDVPLITSPLTPEEYDQERVPAADVYAQIIEDLEFAAEHLPLKSQYPSADLGRATQGAAESMLARVYLYTEDYGQAESYARNVIISGEYGLLDDYFTIFTEQGENSSESIFEVQATATEEATGGSQYGQVQGVRGTPNLGWGFNNPSRDLDAAFEPGDLRHQATILFPWEELPDGTGRTVIENHTMEDERYNKKAFAGDFPGTIDNYPVNIRRFRYSDLLLIAAEAAYRNGNEGDARQFLNDVRERARVGRTLTIGILPENASPHMTNILNLGNLDTRVFARMVHEGGPADQAGIESFDHALDRGRVRANLLDMIVSVNGIAITDRESFLDAVDAQSDGATVPVVIHRIRQGQSPEEFTANVTVQELLPDVTASGQALLDAIWQERRVELAMEQKRWFDLIRQGRAAQVMQDIGVNFVTGKHELFPIPQNEIDLSNRALTQNPNW